METTAVVFEQPGHLRLSQVALNPPGDEDCIVEVEWSGISTGTERLLWTGRMPAFPGMGYPLVPGYESVGRVVEAGDGCPVSVGERVFVPGSRGFAGVRGLFGGAAARVVVPGTRVVPVGDALAEDGVLLALAATACHALHIEPGGDMPDLIVGHGVLGRLVARLALLMGEAPPTVWETNPGRRVGGEGYPVIDPADDPRNDYRLICDVSGDTSQIDGLIARLAPRGTLLLAGFYEQPLSFAFPPAFMREARLQVAAEWTSADLTEVIGLVRNGRLSLAGLITHRRDATQAANAYQTAFEDSDCLKMVLEWGGVA
ncbi:MAG: chlorophyll synthesis pathway protein BchC [Gammaproteobacteria bacterium]